MDNKQVSLKEPIINAPFRHADKELVYTGTKAYNALSIAIDTK
jgi:hypothetical protein